MPHRYRTTVASLCLLATIGSSATLAQEALPESTGDATSAVQNSTTILQATPTQGVALELGGETPVAAMTADPVGEQAVETAQTQAEQDAVYAQQQANVGYQSASTLGVTTLGGDSAMAGSPATAEHEGEHADLPK
ncbi:hypothetical protein [Maricaulis sp. CAU 1757]